MKQHINKSNKTVTTYNQIEPSIITEIDFQNINSTVNSQKINSNTMNYKQPSTKNNKSNHTNTKTQHITTHVIEQTKPKKHTDQSNPNYKNKLSNTTTHTKANETDPSNIALANQYANPNKISLHTKQKAIEQNKSISNKNQSLNTSHAKESSYRNKIPQHRTTNAIGKNESIKNTDRTQKNINNTILHSQIYIKHNIKESNYQSSVKQNINKSHKTVTTNNQIEPSIITEIHSKNTNTTFNSQKINSNTINNEQPNTKTSKSNHINTKTQHTTSNVIEQTEPKKHTVPHRWCVVTTI